VLVTGGAGYVGSIVVDELLKRGYRVRALDSLRHGPVSSLLLSWGSPNFEFLHADVRDREAVPSALEDINAVVHLAAIVGDPACAREPDEAREVNLEATRALVTEARERGIERFLFASTCSNYGRLSGDQVATEEFPLSPISLYAETKVEAEHDVLGQAENGLVACCLRFATVYGTSPRMRFDLTVNEFTRDVALDRELVVFGEQFWRPYVHVRDGAAAITLALEAPRERVQGAVFNVGDTDENYRKLDLVELLRRRFPNAKISFVHRDEDPRDYRVSFEKVRDELGFAPSHCVRDGIDEVVGLLSSGLLDDPFSDAYRN
jgi:nucleoside-diphosphate-sugar epimerase